MYDKTKHAVGLAFSNYQFIDVFSSFPPVDGNDILLNVATERGGISHLRLTLFPGVFCNA
jgi:hypothetical protein